MNDFVVWPFVVLTALLVLILTPKRLFSCLDVDAGHGRVSTLDGLRGFLALAVFFHHMELGHFRITPEHPTFPSHFFAMLGPLGVSVFFMITGFLFWSKLINATSSIRWVPLYIGRFFRIAPLYVVVALVYLIATYHAVHVTGFAPGLSKWHALYQALQWLAFGMVQTPEFFLNYPNSVGMIGQSWSLYYEWLFYLSLPLLALCARNRVTVPFVVAALVLVLFVDGVVGSGVRFFIAQFLVGMLAASLARDCPKLIGDGVMRSLAAVVLLVGVFMFTDTAYSKLATALLGGFFVLIASGASLFGLFNLVGARRLGNVSYSLYLTHGALLVLMFTSTPLGQYAMEGKWQFIVSQAIQTIMLLALCVITYLAVEKPGITLGLLMRRRTKQSGVPSGAIQGTN